MATAAIVAVLVALARLSIALIETASHLTAVLAFERIICGTGNLKAISLKIIQGISALRKVILSFDFTVVYFWSDRTRTETSFNHWTTLPEAFFSHTTAAATSALIVVIENHTIALVFLAISKARFSDY